VNSRERVLTAISHREPDRVPLSLGGTASSYTDNAYRILKTHLGLEGDVKPYRYGHTGTYHDDRIHDALDTDYRYLVLSYKDDSHLIFEPDGSFTDEWGIRKKNVDGYVGRIGRPLKDATLDDLERHTWPDPYHIFCGQKEALAKRAEFLSTKTDKAIVARSAMSTAFLENGAWMLGFEDFMVRLISDEPFSAKFIEKILNIQIAMYDIMLDGAGPYVHIVETAEDYGTSNSLLLSPHTYRKMIMPARKRLNAFISEKAPKAKILHHTCGAVARLIPDLIESGIDILNPVQPTSAAMDPAKLKAAWGDKICFDGGVDTTCALPGTVKQLEAEAARCILALAPGGGYSLGPSNHIQEDVPPQNVVLLYQIAKELGRYPLDLELLTKLASA
jgi:uroporphyrinogen decarboxylase